jgi:hypothetical protein
VIPKVGLATIGASCQYTRHFSSKSQGRLTGKIGRWYKFIILGYSIMSHIALQIDVKLEPSKSLIIFYHWSIWRICTKDWYYDSKNLHFVVSKTRFNKGLQKQKLCIKLRNKKLALIKAKTFWSWGLIFTPHQLLVFPTIA